MSSITQVITSYIAQQANQRTTPVEGSHRDDPSFRFLSCFFQVSNLLFFTLLNMLRGALKTTAVADNEHRKARAALRESGHLLRFLRLGGLGAAERRGPRGTPRGTPCGVPPAGAPPPRGGPMGIAAFLAVRVLYPERPVFIAARPCLQKWYEGAL
jgi:hypothetical protein